MKVRNRFSVFLLFCFVFENGMLIVSDSLSLTPIQVGTGILRVTRVRLALTRGALSRVSTALCPTPRIRFAGTGRRSPGSRSDGWRRSFTGRITCPGRGDASWRPPWICLKPPSRWDEGLRGAELGQASELGNTGSRFVSLYSQSFIETRVPPKALFIEKTWPQKNTT